MLGVLPGIVGSLQASEALKLVLGHRRDARRPPAPLRRARHDLRRGRDPPQPGVPGLRRVADDHRVHRLRRVLPGPRRARRGRAGAYVVTVVRIPPTLRNEVGGARQVEASGETSARCSTTSSSATRALASRSSRTAASHRSSTSTSAARTCARSTASTPPSPRATVILLPAMAGGIIAAVVASGGLEPARPRRLHAARRAAAALAEAGRHDLREARGAEPDGVDQGPRREGDDRGGRGLRRARARAGAARADVREHRHLARARRLAQGLPAHLRDARERDRGAQAAAAALRRRHRLLARRGRARTAPSAWRSRWPRPTRSWFVPFQYANPANPRAHYEGTGAEIAAALERVDVVVAGLGTGGTLMGVGERLRESFPDVVVAAAEPLPGDPVMGLRSLEDGYVPPILDVSQLDRKVLVSNEESVAAVRELLAARGSWAASRRRRRPRRAPARGRARRGRRRDDPRRRRLEVPERRLLGRVRRTRSESMEQTVWW